MIKLIISGGQTGADQGGLRAARACGIPTGGWAPRGWLTEAGPAPWLADWGLSECTDGETKSERYRARRRRPAKPILTAYRVTLAAQERSATTRLIDRTSPPGDAVLGP